MKKNIEKSDAPTSSATASALATLRLRKICSGITGCLTTRSSTITNATSITTASAIRPIVWNEPQPALSASTSA